MRQVTPKEGITAGMVGGLAGGAAMLGMMMLSKQMGMIQTPFPLQIEHELEDRLHVAAQTGPRQEMLLAVGEHMAISAAFGAAYGVLDATFDLPVLPSGPLYGVGVYALKMLGVGPALGLSSEPWNLPASTDMRRLMLHMLFGGVTAAVSCKVVQAGAPATRPSRLSRPPTSACGFLRTEDAREHSAGRHGC